MKTLLLMSIIALGLPAFGSTRAKTLNTLSKISCSIHSAAGIETLERGTPKTEEDYAAAKILEQEVGLSGLTSTARMIVENSGKFKASVSTVDQEGFTASNEKNGDIESIDSDLFMLSVSNGHTNASLLVVADLFTSLRCKLK